MQNCYWYRGIDSDAKAGAGYIYTESDKAGMTKLNKNQIVNENSFIGFDFTNVWKIDPGEPPYLRDLPKPTFNLPDESPEPEEWKYHYN